MRLNAETKHLLEKHLEQALRPLEIAGTALGSTLLFAAVYICRCSEVRHSDPGLATVGIISFACASVAVSALALVRYRLRRPSRAWIALAACAYAAFLSAYSLGDRYWWRHLARYYTWQQMASYVNVDPDSDRGQSFMDAGTMYFKEGSYVLRNHTIAFRNGLVYCVAPIVRAPIEYQGLQTQLQTVNGFVLPRSGTVDFWAVGTDCCGANGETFECGDVASRMARSGLRVLDEMSRSMYLLGVQEWSATTGLPVRHPLFFSWVKDPIMFAEDLKSTGAVDLLTRVIICFFASLVASFSLHGLLKGLRVH